MRKWTIKRHMKNHDLLKKYQIDRHLLSQITNFQVDSRRVSKGSVFFALKGEQRAGEDFLKQVFDNEGVIAFVSKECKKLGFELKTIKVDDTLDTLQALAKEKLSDYKGKTIGITGSSGKTTTKDFVAKLLEGDFKVKKTIGNANSQIGLPLTVLNSDLDCDVQILEMGMSKKGHIQKLTEIAIPDIALITNVGYAHAENFDSLEKIAEAKSEILKDANIKIVDYQLLQYDCIRRHSPITFSINDKRADYFLDIKTGHLYEKSEKAVKLALPFQEASFLHDLLGSIAVTRQLKISYENIQLKLLNLKIPSMRFEKFEKNNILFINDSYSSNPSSLLAAIQNLSFYERRRVAVIGPMLELGRYSEQKHFELGEVAAEKIDILFTIGKDTEAMHKAFLNKNPHAYHFSDLNLLALTLLKILKEEDVVLVKGSRAVQLEKLFEII